MLNEYTPVWPTKVVTAAEQQRAAVERHHAARTVAANADSAGDADRLLAVLGLTAADGLDRTAP